MDPETITLGKYSLPVILSLVLGLIFKRATIPNDLKPYVATAAGILTGLAAMYYNQADPVTFTTVVDYILAGAIAGTSATGIYEMSKPSENNRYIAVDQNNEKIPGAKVVRLNQKIFKT